MSETSNGFLGTSFLYPILKQCDETRFDVLVPRYALYTDGEIELNGEPYDLINGKIDRRSIYKRELVRLPATAIIEIIDNGVTVGFPSKKELTRFTDFLLEVLDKMEGYVDRTTEDIYGKIKDVLKFIYTNKYHTIKDEKDSRVKSMGVVGFGDDYLTANKLGSIKRISTISLDEVIVK